jgi:hypothetical protein
MSPTMPSAGAVTRVVLQLHLILANLRRHGFELRFGGLHIRFRLLELLAADRARIEQLLHARQLLPRIGEVSFTRGAL